jgi:hypothetical protein
VVLRGQIGGEHRDGRPVHRRPGHACRSRRAGRCTAAVDELGPLIPRVYPAQPGWTSDGNRVKEEVAYWREPEKIWVYGGLRIRDGHAVTMCADRRNSFCYQYFLALLEADNPVGQIVVVTDNLSSHTSVSTREWLAGYPRIRQIFIPKNACRLNLQEPWWRMFRRQGTRWTATGQWQRHPPCDGGRHRPAQREGQTLDLGPATTTETRLPAKDRAIA